MQDAGGPGLPIPGPHRRPGEDPPAESVRQTYKRILDKVRRLAVDDPYFAPLADLPLLRRAS